ncbi:hypothetical protein H4Q26_000749 [Puccinia striiformis f. sp. tritici PST-130]|nr:hypothetical protein H4Q26_000749 [Puccinia striiformis f. sp. tritici PST-130]
MSEESKIPPADNRTTPGDKTRSTNLPLCWGHRGVSRDFHSDSCVPNSYNSQPVLFPPKTTQASATFPENTLCSFEAAIKDGAEGIESGKRGPFQWRFPSLERTTDGEDVGVTHGKDNQHVILNVDCKPNNDPARLFKLIKTSIDRYAAHETSLNGRIILGIWHPKFIGPSVEILPDLKKVYIGTSPSTARKYFWESCSGFSMKFSCLVGFEGQKFRQDCIKYHKSLFVWTVNDRLEMIEASKWGVDAILTDKTADYLELRRQMKDDWEAITAETSILFPYRSIHYNGLVSWLWGTIDSYSLARSVGPFHSISTQ